ncbi:MAG: hypothetical protein OJF47_003797 [Nitrospira sp.]|nr:MAG: hypothetical protein OJF47_003797 [Nitrospira sp.]
MYCKRERFQDCDESTDLLDGFNQSWRFPFFSRSIAFSRCIPTL